jgi:hypothetical protein
MPSAGLEPVNTATKWSHNYTSDRTATGIGFVEALEIIK